MTSDSPQSVVLYVLDTCREGHAYLEKAATAVADAHLRKVLGEFAEQRAQFALQLETVLRRMGAEGASSGIQARGWSELQEPLAGGAESILDRGVRFEETALQTYQSALSRDIPETAREILTAQCLQVEEVLMRMKELRTHVQSHPTA